MNQQDRIRALINRLARLDASESWSGDLNPAQREAIGFLARANRFSRQPSHVAAYLGTTRGTISQTLKTLARKGYVTERRSETDRRSISYDLTDAGRDLTAEPNLLRHALNGCPPDKLGDLEEALSRVLREALTAAGDRPFGICRTCRHFRPRERAGFCALLSEALAAEEIEQICHEQLPA